MDEQTTQEELDYKRKPIQELQRLKIEGFEKNGYLFMKDLWDPKELYSPVPKETGQYTYWGNKEDQFKKIPVEMQVEGSTSRY